jgi:uncharacterized membrane protein
MDVASIFRLIALAAIWGSSFLFLRIGVPVFGPGVLIELRVGLAALFLWLVSRLLGRRPLLVQHWRHFLIIGLLNSALPFLLFAYAAQTLTASLLSILNSSAPIFGAIIVALWLRQPVSRSTALGLLLGMVGVATLVAGSSMVHGDGWGLALAAALAAPFCYGLASVYTKQSSLAVDPTDNAHGSMWAAAILVLPFAFFFAAAAKPCQRRLDGSECAGNRLHRRCLSDVFPIDPGCRADARAVGDFPYSGIRRAVGCVVSGRGGRLEPIVWRCTGIVRHCAGQWRDQAGTFGAGENPELNFRVACSAACALAGSRSRLLNPYAGRR